MGRVTATCGGACLRIDGIWPERGTCLDEVLRAMTALRTQKAGAQRPGAKPGTYPSARLCLISPRVRVRLVHEIQSPFDGHELELASSCRRSEGRKICLANLVHLPESVCRAFGSCTVIQPGSSMGSLSSEADSKTLLLPSSLRAGGGRVSPPKNSDFKAFNRPMAVPLSAVNSLPQIMVEAVCP
jgi:hypothetical protein